MCSHRRAFKYPLLLVILAWSVSARAQESAAPFPFVLPWDDASPNILDVSALNPKPAGASGQIVAKNGHFYDETGRRVRFLGVNVTADGCFPEKAVAEKVAARLHKFGVNIVRFHHMDAAWARINLFDPAHKDTQHLNKEALDRLDYFVAQLKANGIYTNLNLHVSRPWAAGDSLPETDQLPFAGKKATYFYPRMIELQKQFARDLLTHQNPYTQMRYTEDPAVAVIEITNENSLIGLPWETFTDFQKELPPAYRQELLNQWNAWLKTKYKTTTGLKRAWSASDKPFGPNLLLNADFMRGAERWNLEINMEPANAKMQLPDDVPPPKDVTGKVVRLVVETLGTQNWHLQFHQAGLDLLEGEPYTVTFWARADRERPLGVYTSIDKDDYHNIGLQSSASLTREWQKFTFSFTASRTLEKRNRLTFVLGDALGTVDLAGIQLRPGVETEFPQGATLEKGTVPLGNPVANPAGQDWITFLLETERAYLNGMRDFIKKELGAKALVIGSQGDYGGLGGLLREARSDFIDMHAYWQHPNFPRQSWDPVDWNIGNASMLKDPNYGTLIGLARYRMAGKPFTVSEYNHAAPNDYQAECVPILTAFAAVQDWDGFYLFDYNGAPTPETASKITGFFDVASNPAKMAFLPAAAYLFLRNDMPLAFYEMRLRVPEGNVPGMIARNGKDIAPLWEAAGITRADALTNRFSVAFVPGKRQEKPAPPRDKPREDVVNRPTGRGPITWEREGDEPPVFAADSPSSKVLVGFLGGKSLPQNGWVVQMSETPRNFAALMLTAVDGQPMERSRSLLLTAVGSVENQGMVWNAERNSVGDRWGSGPTLAEGVPAVISVRTLAASAKIYALDSTGKRAGEVEGRIEGGMLTFTIGPAHKTLWYEVELSREQARPKDEKAANKEAGSKS